MFSSLFQSTVFSSLGNIKERESLIECNNMKNTILWYDLETFGLNPRYDRIAQAAAIRTDMDLNVIDQPLLLYSKLSPYSPEWQCW